MIIFIGFLTVVLILVCALMTLLILMQKPSANAGMGSALGGGASEQVFGGDTGNVLGKWTIYGLVAFFVLAFGIYLLYMAGADLNAEPASASSMELLEEEEVPAAAEQDADATDTEDAAGTVEDTPAEEATAPAEPAPETTQ